MSERRHWKRETKDYRLKTQDRVQKKKGKKEGWECFKLPALSVNVMMCGYFTFRLLPFVLLYHRSNFLWAHGPVIDTNIIDQT